MGKQALSGLVGGTAWQRTLTHAAPAQERWQGPHQQPQVGEQAATAGVAQVHADPLVKTDRAAGLHLPGAGHPGGHLQPAARIGVLSETAGLERAFSCAAEIHADICQYGVDPTGAHFGGAYGDPYPDASLLLLAIHGFTVAAENVMLPLEFSHQEQVDARERAHGLLDLVGLGDRLSALPREATNVGQLFIGVALGTRHDKTVFDADVSP